MFRNLRANEIECRIGTINEKGLSLLLYKDARADMIILDESVGAMNWKREHIRDNHNCIVSIWDSEKTQWVGKEDTGTESYTEKEKGLASDSFKRACVNWGIGRELYTSPFIWINAKQCNIKERNGKKACYDKFEVSSIEITESKEIIGLQIFNKSTGEVVFQLDIKPEKKPPHFEKKTRSIEDAETHGMPKMDVVKPKTEIEMINKLYADISNAFSYLTRLAPDTWTRDFFQSCMMSDLNVGIITNCQDLAGLNKFLETLREEYRLINKSKGE